MPPMVLSECYAACGHCDAVSNVILGMWRSLSVARALRIMLRTHGYTLHYNSLSTIPLSNLFRNSTFTSTLISHLKSMCIREIAFETTKVHVCMHVYTYACMYSTYVYVIGSEKTPLIAQLCKKIFLRGTENLTIFYRLQFVSGE